jgi:hypothetical protein
MSDSPPAPHVFPWNRQRKKQRPTQAATPSASPSQTVPFPWDPSRLKSRAQAIKQSDPDKDTLKAEKRRHEPARPLQTRPKLELSDVITSHTPSAKPAQPLHVPSEESVKLAERLKRSTPELLRAVKKGEVIKLSPAEKVVDLETFATTTESLLLTSSGRMLDVVTARVLRFLEAVEGIMCHHHTRT